MNKFIFFFAILIQIFSKSFAGNVDSTQEIKNFNKGYKIAIIDISKILRESKIGKSINQQAKDLLEKNHIKMLEIEDNLRKEKEISNQKDKTLNIESYNKALESYNDKYNNFIQLSKALKFSWENAVNKGRYEFLKIIQKTINDLQKTLHFDIVIEKNSIFYYKDELDITSAVQKKLDDLDILITIKLEGVENVGL